jgi:two-component system, chemotaxis family, protein-glutamate methylesterase/glutaminase
VSTPVAARTIDVLVVDDAVVVRRMLSDTLASDPALRVVATAADGRIALQKLQQTRPDVVTLDIEMPELDGIETLKVIRRLHPSLPVIMFSASTERGAARTLDALACGADDYVTKPANTGSLIEVEQRIREDLIPRIKALCRATAEPPAPRRMAARRQGRIQPATEAAVPEVVVIGVSTGGPNALASLLPALPHDLPVPVLIVQHMPPMFTKLLADRLDAQSGLHVLEGTDGTPLAPGTVYIAPGDHHMSIAHRGDSHVIELTQGPPENSCRPAADVLFRSASALFEDRVLGVVLTGMGHDGLRGCEAIRRGGGRVLAQDRRSSVVWGMPGLVSGAGLAEEVLPLSAIAAAIIRRCTPAR